MRPLGRFDGGAGSAAPAKRRFRSSSASVVGKGSLSRRGVLLGAGLMVMMSSLLWPLPTSAQASSSSQSRPGEVATDPVPRPSLSGVEASVRQQLEDALGRVEQLTGQGASSTALADAFGALGRLYHAYRFEDAAAGAYARAHALDPTDPAWPYLQAAIHQRNRQLDLAEDALRATLELAPEDVPSRLRLGQVLRLASREGQAEEILLGLLASPAVHSLSGARSVALYELGRLAASDGHLEQAAEHFEAALAAAPKATAVRQHLGLVYRRLGDLEGARSQLTQAGPVEPVFEDPWAVGLLPTGATARLLMGNRAFRRGDFEAALAHHRAAHRAEPESPAVLRALALTLERRGERAEALELYDRAWKRSPDDPLLAYDWARARLAKGGSAGLSDADLEAALDALGHAVELAPAYLEARLLLAANQAERGQLDAAKAHFDVVLELSPGHPQARRGRALLEVRRSAQYLEREARADAIGALQAAVHLDPELNLARLDLARLLLAEGRHAEAAAELVAVTEASTAQLERSDLAAGTPTENPSETHPEPFDIVPPLLDAARLFAASPQPGVRDGSRALELAQRAFRLAPSPDGAEVMAMALAASSAYEQAVAWQERLLGQARAASAPAAYLRRLEDNLERYRSGQIALPPWS